MTIDVQEEGMSMAQSSVAVPSNPLWVDTGGSSVNSVQSDLESSGEAHAIKIRKPYTITKQRERWTEEEHNKFLEALKLHGRAWRRIEEHIGTKSAVQIRSHAQKFFSKVVRESGNNSEVKPIEIPPPRPKRKPVHPYPRKSGNLSSKASPFSEQLESLSPTKGASACELENRSPTSVLSTVGSDVFSSTLSNNPNSCTSPVSSAAGSKHAVLAYGQENRDQSSSISAEQGSGSPSSQPEIATATTKDQSPMDLDLGLEGHDPRRLSSPAEPKLFSLKLFGRTVLVTDSHKPSSSTIESTGQCGQLVSNFEVESHQSNACPDQQSHAETPPKDLMQGDSSCSLEKNSWTPWPVGMPPMLSYFALQSDGTNSTQAGLVPLPWWSFYGNLPYPFIYPQHRSSRQDSPQVCREGVDEKDCYWSNGSYTSSVYNIVAGERNNDAVDSIASETSLEEQTCNKPWEKSAPSSWKPRTVNTSRGFVPYKRHAEENQVEREGGQCQRVRLCL